MTREELNNKIHSKIVNDELYEDEIMEDIMQLVDVHVKEQLRIGGVSQSVAKEWGEFIIRCDREGRPLLLLEDYIEQYCA